ncbi:MAG: hypothetical protein ACOH2E_05905 [Candidatus Paracaedibacter sp.]
MLDRFLIIILIIIANGMNASTFAEELTTQLNIQGKNVVQPTSPITVTPSTPSDKPIPKESRNLIYNPRLPDMKQMLQPAPPISPVIPIIPQIPENSPSLVKAESNNKSDDQYLAKTEAAKQCSGEIMTNLKKVYVASQKELNSIISYVGFGILIAIFSMGANFRIKNRLLVNFSLSFAIGSIILNFLACLILYQTSKSSLMEAKDTARAQGYSNMSDFSNYLFWGLVILLTLAAATFGWLGYKFMYYTKNEKQKSIHAVTYLKYCFHNEYQPLKVQLIDGVRPTSILHMFNSSSKLL